LLILSVNRISRILQFVWKRTDISRNLTRELIHELCVLIATWKSAWMSVLHRLPQLTLKIIMLEGSGDGIYRWLIIFTVQHFINWDQFVLISQSSIGVL